MNRRNRSDGISPLAAVILLIAITVAAAVVISGVFFNLAGIAGRRPTVLIDQVKLVAQPGAGDDATFTIVLKNTGDVPIHATTDPDVTFSGLPAGSNLAPTDWSGSRDPGGTLSGTENNTSGCSGLVGQTILVTVTVTFADGSVQILTTGVTGVIA